MFSIDLINSTIKMLADLVRQSNGTLYPSMYKMFDRYIKDCNISLYGLTVDIDDYYGINTSYKTGILIGINIKMGYFPYYCIGLPDNTLVEYPASTIKLRG
ncbi:hypothetical protein VWJ25_05165 [Escherichia coli O157]|uniref:Uncharacterized protein n=1 Tax=Escherichia phage PBECO4 TaxID=1273738 RepID=L7TL81_9CAUD|nr:hypothetical protein ACQ29_gp133 [Escherichia phage PBECO4]EGE5868605.1 hypothetical protein [Escherichia coli]MED6562177.1 hypothetical protein [Escherichia coli O157]QXN76153.1 hypothetical protein [Escherichia phage BF17]WIL00686.1 hypothetical protein [Escherichia phage vB_EcoM_CRJP21]WPK19649.1 hypothetical protein [Salmonella phage SD-1_S14]